MRVLLINPPVEDFYFTPQRAYPLGLLYLAASLPQEFEVKILNCSAYNKKATLKFPKEFEYLKDYYKQNKSPFHLFSNYCHFGLTYQEIEETVRDFKPQIVGISANFSPYFDSAQKTAQIVKNIDKNTNVVFGGRVPTALPDFALKNRYIDFVVRGEAEYSFSMLCKCLEEGRLTKIKGLCYRLKNKNIIDSNTALIKNLDLLPFPARNLIDANLYKFKGRLSASFLSSRGCALGCAFCGIKERFRVRSPENIFKEIVESYNFGIRHFNFEDDNISLNPAFENILDLIIDNFEGKITISFMNGLLSKGINTNLQTKLQKSGLTHIDLSLISSKKAIRVKVLRKEPCRDLFCLADSMANRNIPATVHFIVSLPHQSFRNCLCDLITLAKKRAFLGPSIFYPVIESRFFSYLNKEFSITDKEYEYFRSSCAYFDKFMQRSDIFFIFYFSRIINFIKQLIDLYSLNTKKFGRFLMERSEGIDIKALMLVADAKLDKINLGVIILRKMIAEHKIFRVEEHSAGGKIKYTFIEEKFVNNAFVAEMIKKLKIRGVIYKSVVELACL